MIKAESKIRIKWQPMSDAIQVHYEPKTELQPSYRRKHGVSLHIVT